MKKLNEMTTLWDDRPTADSRPGGREGEDNRDTGWAENGGQQPPY